MFQNCKNSKAQGNIGLGSAIEYFTRNNFIVSVPLNDSQDYDLIIDDGIKLQKIQVKTSRSKTKYGSYCVDLRVSGGNATNKSIVRKTSKETQYDLLFVLCDDGTKYLIPKEEFKNLVNSIKVGNNYKKFQVL